MDFIQWKEIPGFPEYSISDHGIVYNDNWGRQLTPSVNQHGVAQVGLMHKGVQYKRGVALLVASLYLDPHPSTAFNTPINLNGDRLYNHVDNLMWRPRWFAVKYHRQFHMDHRQGFGEPIVEVKTGEEFPTSWEAAVKYGLLDREIMLATINRTYVWPTFQRFRVLR